MGRNRKHEYVFDSIIIQTYFETAVLSLAPIIFSVYTKIIFLFSPEGIAPPFTIAGLTKRT
jgi:hypothetical protein